MLSYVIKRIVIINCKFFDGEADPVRRFRLKITGLYVYNLIKKAFRMIPCDLSRAVQIRFRIKKLLGILRVNFQRLLPGEFLRSKSVFYFVAVEFCFVCADDGQYFG